MSFTKKKQRISLLSLLWDGENDHTLPFIETELDILVCLESTIGPTMVKSRETNFQTKGSQVAGKCYFEKDFCKSNLNRLHYLRSRQLKISNLPNEFTIGCPLS